MSKRRQARQGTRFSDTGAGSIAGGIAGATTRSEA